MERYYSLNEMMRGTGCVLCYGCGNAADVFVKYCKSSGIDIAGFLVTQKAEKQDTFHGKKVWQLDEYMGPFTFGIVIAVVFPQYVKEIIESLSSKEVKVLWLYDDKAYIHAIRSRLHKAILKRKKYSIFDFKKLAAPLYYEDVAGSGYLFYGIYKAVKKYTQRSQLKIKQCGISHGASNNTMIISSDKYLAEKYHTLYVCGGRNVWETRVSDTVNVHYLSPYIYYARSLLSYGRLRKIKRKLRKTLLVFPLHSVNNREYMIYDVNAFIGQIEDVQKAHGYDSVLVCMYWCDILMHRNEPYQKKGWKIVTAGHRLDTNFLRRLRSIFSLADMVVTNGVGTHVGYAICMKKPVYILDLPSRDTVFEVNKNNYGEAFARELVLESRISEQEIKQPFLQYSENITQEQISVVKKYWGEWNEHRYLRQISIRR